MKILKSKLFKIFLALILIFVLDFYFGQDANKYLDKLLSFSKPFLNKINPCSQSINYSLGEVDSRFELTDEELLNTLSLAEEIWEKPIGRNLFDFSEAGALKINLIYDYRQEATEKLKKLGITIDDTKESYDKLKASYNSLLQEYALRKSNLDKQIADYEARSRAYEKEVSYWNKKGGISAAQRKKIEATRISLNNQAAAINQEQAELKNLVDEINAMVNVMNRLVNILNLGVENYNTIGATRGEKFQEGEYVRDINGERINIYQFDDKNKLLRVLAHELGHALGVEHNNNPDSIMYAFNEGKNEKLSQDDINDMQSLCGTK